MFLAVSVAILSLASCKVIPQAARYPAGLNPAECPDYPFCTLGATFTTAFKDSMAEKDFSGENDEQQQQRHQLAFVSLDLIYKNVQKRLIYSVFCF
jgi:hypothetical protein